VLEDRTLLSAGSFDRSFGQGDVVRMAGARGTAPAQALAVKGDGKIAVAGKGRPP
jgi:hypothetical protein